MSELRFLNSASEDLYKQDRYSRILDAEIRFSWEFSTRATNLLKKLNINTTRQLAEQRSYDLLKVKGLGRKCLNEIIDYLDDLGLRLNP